MATYYSNFQDIQTIIDSFSGTTDNVLIDRLSPLSTFTVDSNRTLKDILILRDIFTPHSNSSRILTDSLQVRNSFSSGLSSLEYIGRPIPTFLTPTPNVPPTPITSQNLGPFSPGTLTYPETQVTFESNGVSLTLKAPEFANKDVYDAKRINVNTRGLTLVLYRDPIWPESTTYDVNFTLLDEEEVSRILRFLRSTVGHPVTYVDMYGETHIGFIPDPESPATSAAGGYSIRFTFLEATPA